MPHRLLSLLDDLGNLIEGQGGSFFEFDEDFLVIECRFDVLLDTWMHKNRLTR